MKPLSLCLTTALCLTLPAMVKADLTLVQKSDAAGARNPMVIKIKGGKIRVDSGSEQTNLIDTATGEMTVLVHGTKKGVKSSLKKGEEAHAINGAVRAASNHRPLGSGKMEKVGTYDCEIHDWDFGGGIKSRLWVVKNYPNYEAIRKDLETLVTLGGVNALNDINGMVIKSTTDLGGATATTTLEEVKTGELPDADFVVPAGYEVEQAQQKKK